MAATLTKPYITSLKRCGIGDEQLVELMEAAWWALQYRQNAVGYHLDLCDEYLCELRGKLHAFLNPNDGEE